MGQWARKEQKEKWEKEVSEGDFSPSMHEAAFFVAVVEEEVTCETNLEAFGTNAKLWSLKNVQLTFWLQVSSHSNARITPTLLNANNVK